MGCRSFIIVEVPVKKLAKTRKSTKKCGTSPSKQRIINATQYHRIYCHKQGENLGDELQTNYNSQEAAQTLIASGDQITPGTPLPGDPVDTACVIFDSLRAALSGVDIQIEYLYLWDGDEWLMNHVAEKRLPRNSDYYSFLILDDWTRVSDVNYSNESEV